MDFTALIRLSRPEVGIGIGASVIIGMVIATAAFPPEAATIGFIIGFLISSASMISNDIFDIEVDRINAPHRALPSGKVSIKQAWVVTGLSAGLGLILAIMWSWVVGLLTLVFTILAFAYNYRVKEWGIWGNLIVSTSAILPFVIGGLMVDAGDNAVIWTIAMLTFLANLSGELTGGIMDYEGDRVRNQQSVAHVIGFKNTFILAIVLLSLSVGLVWLPVIVKWLGQIYTIMAVLYSIGMGLVIRGYLQMINVVSLPDHLTQEREDHILRLKNIMFYVLMLGLPMIIADVLLLG